jgi:inner membrane protease subunit 2
MTPYLNEDYDTMHTKKDIVLVKMWPGLSAFRWGQRKMRIERGMLVLFPYVPYLTSYTLSRMAERFGC